MGSGKTSIVNHIALIYEQMGWQVYPIDEAREIKQCVNLRDNMQMIFIFNDPIGKQSLDEIAYYYWNRLEDFLKMCFDSEKLSIKLLTTCRRCVIRDKRVQCILNKPNSVIDVDDEHTRMTEEEKQEILSNYTGDHFSKEEMQSVLAYDTAFPLLCRLYGEKHNFHAKGVEFFKFPEESVIKEIEYYMRLDKMKFLALVMLVVCSNNFRISFFADSTRYIHTFENACDMCCMSREIPRGLLLETFESLEGSFVKRVRNKYHFIHDFVMDSTTLLLGKAHPKEILLYCHSAFIRKKIRILEKPSDFEKPDHIIYLEKRHINYLVDRFLLELTGKNVMDVVLSPSLRNEEVIHCFISKLETYSSDALFGKLLLTQLDMSKLMEYDDSNNECFTKLDIIATAGFTSSFLLLLLYNHDKICSYILGRMSSFSEATDHLVSQSIFPIVCANGNMTLVQQILSIIGNDVVHQTWGKNMKICSIHIASVFNNIGILLFLLDQMHVNVNVKSERGFTALFLAASSKHVDEAAVQAGETLNSVSVLLERGADVNTESFSGATAVYMAAQNGHCNILRILVRNGANLNSTRLKGGDSPLHTATQSGYADVMEMLLDNDSDVDMRTVSGATPLFIAAQECDSKIVELLLRYSANVNICRNDGVSPLAVAASKGKSEVAKLLLYKKADVDVCSRSGISPLFIAAQEGYSDIVALLLNCGAHINSKTENGVTPLFAACMKGNYKSVEELLKKHANVNLCEKTGTFPLFVACEKGFSDIVDLLIKKNARVNLCESVNNRSPLFIASARGHYPVIEKLLKAKADVNKCNNDGESPLFKAATTGDPQIVKCLLENHANINLQNSDGMPPLHIAAHFGYKGIVQLLLKHGANPKIIALNGKNAYDIARTQMHFDIAEIVASGIQTLKHDRKKRDCEIL